MQTWSLKPAAHNNKPQIMEMCSKPCRYVLIDLICYSCSDLLIAAFGVRGGFVFVVVLWLFVWTNYGLILLGVDWTLQMSAHNLLIPFISGFCCWCVCLCVCMCAYASVCIMFVEYRWGWVVVFMCWKWVDLIYNGLFAQQGREGASCVCCLCFLSLSFSLLSHICS